MMRAGELQVGIIDPQTLAAFKHCLGIREATLRSARRAGLRVHYVHGRGYILGQEWIRYVLASSSDEAAGFAGTDRA